jgi:hypothetical protein
MIGRENINKPESSKIHLVFLGYVFSVVALFMFSYTQVDLNLTLSQAGIWQEIQKSFQYIGFFQRPIAAFIYLTILLVLFISYILLLNETAKKIVSHTHIWKLILIVCIGLFFSYPATFSYDFFNYLFTAKTVLVYHQNPYSVTPLSFAGVDPWTNFMRWTHLSSAYTPLWIFLSLFPFIAGLGYFILVLFATKAMILGFFLLACWALYRILVLKKSNVSYGLSLFALNPLILIETLISGHNDIVLIAFALVSVYFVTIKNSYLAWVFLSLSIASKLMTIVLLPAYVFRKYGIWLLILMLFGLVVVVIRREFLPWYWVWIVPFIALLPLHKPLQVFCTIISFGLLASYLPYIFIGEYSPIVQEAKTAIIWSSVFLATATVLRTKIRGFRV